MLIGFCGMRTAGKTTAAQVLIKDFGFHQAKFAAPIKSALRLAYGLDYEHTDGKLKEAPTPLLGGASPRDAMEWFGEESRRKFGDEIWVKRWFALNDHVANRFVFDDVRNEVEAAAISAAGGKVIRILNESADCLPILPSEARLHKIKPDFAIRNLGDASFIARIRGFAIAHDLGVAA